MLDEFVGGESQADGVELSWLTPLSQYLTFTLGAYNKIGAENERVNNIEPRPLNQFTYLARPATFFSLNDANSVDLGITWAYTPKVNSYNVDGTECHRRQGAPPQSASTSPTATPPQPGAVPRPHLGNRGAVQQRELRTSAPTPPRPSAARTPSACTATSRRA